MGPIRFLVAAILVVLPAAALADPVASIQAARASAARCDIAAALSTSLSALGEAQAQWPVNDARLMIVHQDVATFANRVLDFRRAESSARAALDMASRKTPPSPLEMALVGQNLAVALAGQGKRQEAAALFEQVLAQMSAGGTPAMVANAELAYSDFDYGAGRPASGLRHIERAAAIAASGTVTPELKATILMRLAAAYRRELAFVKADKALADAQAITGATGSSSRLDLVRADIAYEKGQLTQSLGIVDDIEQARPTFDACDPTFMADVAQRRGTLHMVRRELPEAAAAFTAALASLSAVKLGESQRIGEITYGLAVISGMSKDFDQSARLFDNAAAAFRRIYGGDSEAEAQVLMEKALMLSEAQRPDEAVASARAALTMVSGKVEQAPLTRAYAHASLGLSLQKAGDLRPARRELEIALAAFERARGAESFDLAPGLRALGTIARDTGDLRAAERYFLRALAIERRWGGDSAVSLGTTLSSLADVLERRRDHAGALARSAEAVAVLRRRLAIGEARPWNDAQSERIAARSILTGDLALAAARLAPGELIEDAATVDRMLTAAQLANATTTGSAIAQMTTRLQASSPALGAILGQRNDLSAEWRSIQDQLVGSLALGGNDSDELRDALLKRQQEVAAELGEIDRQLTQRDPKLDLLVKSRVVGLAALQAVLRPKEALLIFTPDKAATFVIVITREKAAAFRSALSLAEVTDLVSRTRAALDPQRWAIDLPIFDGEAAFALYRGLIAPAEAILAGGDEVLTVTEGPMSSLPLSVLLTAPPPTLTGDEEEYKALPWLVRRFAFATYPSVASVVALRGLAAAGSAAGTMLGVGDPVFDGKPGTGLQGGGQILRSMALTRLADVGMLRNLQALPDTRAELITMAGAFPPGQAKLVLGADATETTIRTAPLDRYGMIVFATHGIVAGELSGYAEPGLALTPPAVASPQDDGLLSASEVATLKLRSRWVILSACNTAASDGEPSGEPLSGLAKSFFYAGARSLLVSHWSVDSAAAAKLTSETVALTASGQSASAALRDVELRFIGNDDGSYRTHPFFWAPFALIGD